MQIVRILLLALLLFVLLSPVEAQTVQGLRQTFADVQKTIQEKDLDGFLKLWDEKAIFYQRNGIYPIDRADHTGDGFRQIFEDWFANIYSVSFTKINVDYRVFDGTGLLWGDARVATDARDGTGSDQDRRLTVVFVWDEDSWKIILWNGAPPPMGLNP